MYSGDIYSYLKRQIMCNEIPLGSPIRIHDIADMLNVSITPVREAMIILENEGWVTTKGKNKLVARLSAADTMERIDVRVALERLAFELVRERICPEWIAEMREILRRATAYDMSRDANNYMLMSNRFHLFLSEKSGNQYLYKTLSDIVEHMMAINICRYETSIISRRFVLSEHEKLLEYLEKERWEDYEQMLVKHIRLWPEFSKNT